MQCTHDPDHNANIPKVCQNNSMPSSCQLPGKSNLEQGPQATQRKTKLTVHLTTLPFAGGGAAIQMGCRHTDGSTLAPLQAVESREDLLHSHDGVIAVTVAGEHAHLLPSYINHLSRIYMFAVSPVPSPPHQPPPPPTCPWRCRPLLQHRLE
jgi:hypothetical protein